MDKPIAEASFDELNAALLRSQQGQGSDIGSNNESPAPAEGENSQATSVNSGDETKKQGESNANQEGDSGTLESSKGEQKAPEKKIEKLPVDKPKEEPSAQKRDKDKEKEEARKDRSWKAYQEREEARKKRDSEFDQWSKAETERIKRAVEEAEAKAAEILKKAEEAQVQKDTQFTPEQLEEFAEQLEAEGKTADAKLVKEQAKKARQQQAKAQELKQQKRLEGMRAEADKWDKKALEEFPELKDTNSEFFGEAKKLYLGQSDLNQLPRGLWLAAEYTKQRREASKVPELQKKISELEEQLKNTKAKLVAPADAAAPTGSPVASKSSLEEAPMDDLLDAYRKKTLGV